MQRLVADYGSESEEEEPDSSQSSDKASIETPLPAPRFVTGSDDNSQCSVFLNPFLEADNAKQAILEKHVKMTTTEIKKIKGDVCWGFAKTNRCRFGDKCKFLHIPNEDIGDSGVIKSNQTNVKQVDVKKLTEFIEFTPIEEQQRKKRPGLCNNIVPSKKVMKKYFNDKKNS